MRLGHEIREHEFLRGSLGMPSQGPNFGNALSQQATGPRAAVFITVITQACHAV